MNNDDGGPAFPHDENASAGMGFQNSHPGMMLRDYFAAAAIGGMLANPERSGGTDASWAEVAFSIADAMILARK